MATIKPIAGRSIHQIQSGQVIVDLCSVVKELVENSLDAGSTSIEVRFKSQGLESIEVQDNGDGIAAEDYETIALKHYTSKLSSYEDLSSLQTFGFRGEALSSLCALSKFCIVTATEDQAPKGQKLEFESSGKLSGTSIFACPRGTTVAVENLFYNLPVRRRELERNIKREYGKVLNILNAYACISVGVRLSVSNQMTKGKKSIVFSTKGNANTKDNIANVFGAKSLLGLIPLDLELELQSSTGQGILSHRQSNGETSNKIRMLGHVSRPVFGEGRQAPDRQMFFVNSRPCNLPQIAKSFNEVYKAYNLTQAPFVFANLVIDTSAYDVNVSPDKRTIMLHDQSSLLETLKESLNQLFQNQEQTMPQSQLYSNQLPSFRPVIVNNRPALASEDDQLSVSEQDEEPRRGLPPARSNPIGESSSDAESNTLSKQPAQLLEKFVTRNHRDRSPNVESAKPKTTVINVNRQPPEPSLAQKEISKSNFGTEARSASSKSNDELQEISGISTTVDANRITFEQMQHKRISSHNATTTNCLNNEEILATSPPTKKRRTDSSASKMESEEKSDHSRPLSNMFAAFAAPGSITVQNANPNDAFGENWRRRVYEDRQRSDSLVSSDDEDDAEVSKQGTNFETDSTKASEVDSDDEYINEEERKKRDEARIQEMVRWAEAAAANPSERQKEKAENILKKSAEKDSTVALQTTLKTSVPELSKLERKIKMALKTSKSLPKHSSEEIERLSAKISPEEKLSLTIAKSDFDKMRIVGQFNLGFILTTRKSAPLAGANHDSEDLFIIDQHASDEIYNFTRLSMTTNLTPQPLVKPHQLELTAAEEETIINNAEIMEKNGFNLSVDESGDLPVGQRCHILTLPTSRETVFNMRDLEELISLLGESNQSSSTADIVRPSKVRKMLAMRACRSSVMVGKSMTKIGMEKLVRHMGEIDRPWNCPHGRPTMRHLAALSEWESWSEGDGLAEDDATNDDATAWFEYLERRGERKQTSIRTDGENDEFDDHGGEG